MSHALLQFREEKFKCEICGLSHRTNTALQIHRDFVHSNIRNFICSTCGLAFKVESLLKRHENVHKAEKRPFKCTFEGCEEIFKSDGTRKTHMKTHTGECDRFIVRPMDVDNNSQEQPLYIVINSEHI